LRTESIQNTNVATPQTMARTATPDQNHIQNTPEPTHLLARLRGINPL
jgi:hypothetical protein